MQCTYRVRSQLISQQQGRSVQLGLFNQVLTFAHLVHCFTARNTNLLLDHWGWKKQGLLHCSWAFSRRLFLPAHKIWLFSSHQFLFYPKANVPKHDNIVCWVGISLSSTYPYSSCICMCTRAYACVYVIVPVIMCFFCCINLSECCQICSFPCALMFGTCSVCIFLVLVCISCLQHAVTRADYQKSRQLTTFSQRL